MPDTLYDVIRLIIPHIKKNKWQSNQLYAVPKFYQFEI